MVKHHYSIHAVMEIKILVEYLIEHGAVINKENKNGRTLLFEAILREYKDLVEYLVERGADLNKENWFSQTPLLYVYYGGN